MRFIDFDWVWAFNRISLVLLSRIDEGARKPVQIPVLVARFGLPGSRYWRIPANAPYAHVATMHRASALPAQGPSVAIRKVHSGDVAFWIVGIKNLDLCAGKRRIFHEQPLDGLQQTLPGNFRQ